MLIVDSAGPPWPTLGSASAPPPIHIKQKATRDERTSKLNHWATGQGDEQFLEPRLTPTHAVHP
jgi:hypothetical protein